MQVDEETIVAKIKDGANTVEKIQEETSAGTGCGGCIPQLEELIEKHAK
ncbi:(2Fe-2S)-binding protein [Mycoplasmatota bacterium]|nr:(2Fe-2S)-binding protein [Mycoplasmatota bacterium]